MFNSSTDNFRKSYDFFCKMENEKKNFSITDIMSFTGWSKSTINTYMSKKWEGLVSKIGNLYFVNGVISYTEEEFIRLMSQKNKLSSDPKKPILSTQIEGLVIKAREAAILSLDIYNRPVTTFRTPGFIVMIVIAWTSLLHAIFERKGIDYIYRDSDGEPILIDGDEKAWELGTCLNNYYGKNHRPEKENLMFLIGLRNKIEHRYVPDIDLKVSGECQSALLNFDELITEEFGDYYSVKETLAVPLQTSSLKQTFQIEAMKKFQSKQYDKIKEYIDTFRSQLADEVFQDPKYSFRAFLVPKIGNHLSSSDMAIEFVKYDPNNHKDMETIKNVALIKERHVPVVNPGKYKPSDVVRLVTEKLGVRFTMHNHTQAWNYYKVRSSLKKPESCKEKFCQYDVVHQDYIYTKEWVDFLVNKLSDDDEYKKLISSKFKKEE